MASQLYTLKLNFVEFMVFGFEYFMQKCIAFKIDKTLEKSCIFHYSESDGLRSPLIHKDNYKELEFMDDERASESGKSDHT